jgi:hypothetical protein
MKPVSVLFVVLLLTVSPLCAQEPAVSAGMFADIGSAQSLAGDTTHLRAGILLDFADQFMLSMPVTYAVQDYGCSLLDTSVNLRWRPFDAGLFAGISFFQSVSLAGAGKPEDWFHYMSEIQAGWHFRIGDILFIEPILLFRDPAGIHEESRLIIEEFVPGYGRFRAAVHIGIIGLEIGDQKT